MRVESDFWARILARYDVGGVPVSDLVAPDAVEEYLAREDRWSALIELRVATGISLDLLVDLSFGLDDDAFATFCRNARLRRETYGLVVRCPECGATRGMPFEEPARAR